MASNEIPIEAWNTVLFEKFCRFRTFVSEGLAGHSDEVFRRQPYPGGALVLDIGCGFGETTQQIAKQVGPEGVSAGVDCAPNFIALARKETAELRIANARFFVADVQSDDLGGPYDHIFSRFGTMFFNLPGAALRNMRRALKPAGALTMIVWRRREDNPWIHEAELLVKEMVPVVRHDETDQVHCGPGPFSMAGADAVSDLMRSAGYRRICFERYDTDIRIGDTLEQAVEAAMALGPAGEIIRLAGDEGVRRRDEVAAALGSLFRRHQRPDGIWAGSSAWIVTATKPE